MKHVDHSRPIPVTAFVDWNAQIHNAKTVSLDNQPVDQAKQTLPRVLKSIKRVLRMESAELRFNVGLRLYHGWHKGWQRTERLRAMMQTVTPEFTRNYSDGDVIFGAVHYGHTLLSALPGRFHEHQALHLPNTLRQQSKNVPHQEKMVDTALAADLLHWARYNPDEWALVVAEDDDFVPPLFAAEAWIEGQGGRALMVRSRPADAYLKLDGLLAR